MSGTTKENPLVTFAVFAYNQEKYIREAVEGAFAQTYEPLEIILSDDCSTDRTLQIMSEMAAEYNGPHMVRVRQSPMNLGTALHLGAVASVMEGSLLVVAAGDDVSEAHRTLHIAKAWGNAGFPVATVHSNARMLDAQLKTIKTTTSLRYQPSEKINLDWFLKRKRLPYIAPTCAYSKELFTNFPPLLGASVIEDSVMACRSMILAQSIAIECPLVDIRIQASSSGRGYTIEDPGRWNMLIRSKIVSRLNRLQDLMAFPSLSPKTSRKVQELLTKEVKQLSKFFATDESSAKATSKLAFFLRIILFYPVRGGWLLRSVFALECVGWRKNRSNTPSS